MGSHIMISSAVLLLVSAVAGFNVPGGFSSKQRVPLSNQRVPNTCSTLTGGTCVFPFTYNGATHHQCTYTDSPTPWCATAVDSSGVVVTNGWGDCEVSATSACQTESITVPTCTTSSGPRPGQSCVFPFRHLGVVYNSCTSVGQSAPWCSTSTTSAGTHIDGEYGFCPSTCPTDSSSSSVTTTTTAAAPITTTTTTTSSTSCIPGSTFPQDCNVCVCDSLGVSVCTTKTNDKRKTDGGHDKLGTGNFPETLRSRHSVNSSNISRDLSDLHIRVYHFSQINPFLVKTQNMQILRNN